VEAPLGVYCPRRPENTPFYRCLEDYWEEFQRGYEVLFEKSYGPLRAARDGRRLPISYLDPEAMTRIFQGKVLGMLVQERCVRSLISSLVEMKQVLEVTPPRITVVIGHDQEVLAIPGQR
jgi:hypothetical protein